MKRKQTCESCGGSNFKNMMTTFPLKYFEKTIMVNKVAVKKCLCCDAMEPTKKEKKNWLDVSLHISI